MATSIHSSLSCLLPFYTIPIFPLFKSKDFSFTCTYIHTYMHTCMNTYIHACIHVHARIHACIHTYLLDVTKQLTCMKAPPTAFSLEVAMH